MSLATSSNPRPQACNHTFEKAAIYNHIKIAGNKKAVCPVAGCTKHVKKAELLPDDAMKRRVSARDDRSSDNVMIQRGRYMFACVAFGLGEGAGGPNVDALRGGVE